MDEQDFGTVEKGKGAGPIIVGVGVAGLLLWWLTGSAKADSGPGYAPASCKKVDETGKYSTQGNNANKCPDKGVASNPDFQWLHVVKSGESPVSITESVFGVDGGHLGRKDKSDPADWEQAFVELIDANPGKETVGVRTNPRTPVPHPDTGLPTWYNFRSLSPGESIKIPKSWNRWIDEEGNYAHSPTPFPNSK